MLFSLIWTTMPRQPEPAEILDPVAPGTSRRMARTAQRDNRKERALRSILHRRGLRFRVHGRLLEGSRRTVDIVFARARVAVFIDGCFWHDCPIHGTSPTNNAAWWRAKIDANVARDRDTDARLVESGWTVVRIWEHEDLSVAADRIEALVRVDAHNAKTRP
ncbi:very short patch repair endonuclease [Mesorhizobium sp.]|uniref:very short patch repair endonuclease n=2 Tax=Mesorhizobium TaxID=68287 RepID=UPI00257EA58A|nr:very short patch repair endonuclease [Mesorhizobium sp.]